MKKSITTQDLKEGMLVSCPLFKGIRVVIGPVYSIASNRSSCMYRVRLVDPETQIAQSFDFEDSRSAFWTEHSEKDDSMPPGHVPCNTYGCMAPKPEGHVFCASCLQDYRDDPDAYK